MKDAVLKKMKEDGHRITAVRKAMIEIFCEQKCLLNAVHMASQLKKKGISADRTTIYRELCFLLAQNVIRKVQLTDGKNYYEIAIGHHHHHLVCTRCNDIREIVLDKHLKVQERKIYKREKFTVAFHVLEFYGLCNKCS